MSEDSFLPKPAKRGWIWIIIVFVLLGTAGVTISLLYRDYTTPEEIRVRERRKNAEQVCLTVVFSKVPSARSAAIIDAITADVGADSSVTDLVMGSTVEDPWSTSMADYRSSLSRAMLESKDISIGKQTLVMSMVAGLLTKMEIPATIYLVGDLNDSLTPGVVKRTFETADAFDIRSSVMGPVRIISYLDTNRPLNRDYLRFFEQRSYSLEMRTVTSP